MEQNSRFRLETAYALWYVVLGPAPGGGSRKTESLGTRWNRFLENGSFGRAVSEFLSSNLIFVPKMRKKSLRGYRPAPHSPAKNLVCSVQGSLRLPGPDRGPSRKPGETDETRTETGR